ncbi:hypothetical protein [Paraurantiacibacter namhicola]|uniref:CDP-Glycerol:Poly(Glycerophosphate) glycerophosphotransferase n=1 Tax=Paraurantiacibacter namhicola TaxID=645517 RepID=A0A1C7D9I1_9SPHN|nr:hypothetical protein [Paraurantiacibacter namhicola]ANU08124.1 hypothetical protein A6F65_01829 [Paraurantiacibacter namhicola]
MPAPPRIMFLYNHDAAHQAAHIAGIMRALALRHPQVEVYAGVAGPAIEAEIRRIAGGDAAARIHWQDLSLSPALDTLLSLPNRLLPAKRLARLRTNEGLFAQMSLIVSTERTCLRVRRRLRAKFGDKAPRFAYVPHGSGDRNVAYHPELAQFDLKLVSGQKLVDEMVARGIATPDQCRLIGYPKFDTIDTSAKPQLFDNDRPVFVYNPHFDPKLSSWYDHGPALLEWFAGQQDRFNLVFAPHVMLFRKALHVSPEYRLARRRPDVPQAALDAPNVLVDTDSERLFDMTYTLGADAYIGDMSSQVYEFLVRRRPCFFIDTHAADLPGEAANRAFWGNGPVVQSVPELTAMIPQWQDIGEAYRDTQDRLFSYTIDDRPGETSVDRAADALAGWLAPSSGAESH